MSAPPLQQRVSMRRAACLWPLAAGMSRHAGPPCLAGPTALADGMLCPSNRRAAEVWVACARQLHIRGAVGASAARAAAATPPPPRGLVPAAAVASAASSAAAAAAQPAHLRNLNLEQLAAVTAPPGVQRVAAGPGSGKTRVLTARIAQLIEHGVQPWQILAITFTNKAADEMKERLAAALGPDAATQLFAGTFHSLCLRILKRSITRLPGGAYTEDFIVYDQDDSYRVLQELVRQDQPDWKGAAANQKAKELQGDISRVKNGMASWHGLSGEEAATEFLRRNGRLDSQADRLQSDMFIKEVGGYMDRYQAALQRSNALDFDDLMGLAVGLLQRDASLRQQYQRRYRHVLVDEFQDTNTAQYALVQLLASPECSAQLNAQQPQQPVADPGASSPCSLFVVGDPDQAIYGWRGADVANMRDSLAKDYPQCQAFYLADNYRSTASILLAAQALIDCNKDWARQALRPRRVQGQPVEVHSLANDHTAAAFVGEDIREVLARGVAGAEVAVLTRTHNQLRLVEQELVKAGIPYALVGGTPFWQRVEIKDVVAYLRLAASLRDEAALGRVLNTPRRGLGTAGQEAVRAAAAARGLTLTQLLFGVWGRGRGGAPPPLPQLEPLPGPKELGVSPNAHKALVEFRDLVLSVRSALCTRPLHEAVVEVLTQTKYVEHVKEGGCGASGKGRTEEERVERVHQLTAAAKDFIPGTLAGVGGPELWDEPGTSNSSSNISEDGRSSSASGAAGGMSPLQLAQAFLDEAALQAGVDVKLGPDAVRLMTMHAAKGLEFEVVYVPGCNEGQLPMGDALLKPELLQEERRLAFVAMTRAKGRLLLLHSRQCTMYGFDPSRQGSVMSQFLGPVLESGHAVLEEHADERRNPHWERPGRDGGRTRAEARSNGRRFGSVEVRFGYLQSADTPSYGQARPATGRPSSSSSSFSTSGKGGSSDDGSGGDGTRSVEKPLSAAQQKAAKRGGRR